MAEIYPRSPSPILSNPCPHRPSSHFVPLPPASSRLNYLCHLSRHAWHSSPLREFSPGNRVCPCVWGASSRVVHAPWSQPTTSACRKQPTPTMVSSSICIESETRAGTASWTTYRDSVPCPSDVQSLDGWCAKCLGSRRCLHCRHHCAGSTSVQSSTTSPLPSGYAVLAFGPALDGWCAKCLGSRRCLHCRHHCAGSTSVPFNPVRRLHCRVAMPSWLSDLLWMVGVRSVWGPVDVSTVAITAQDLRPFNPVRRLHCRVAMPSWLSDLLRIPLPAPDFQTCRRQSQRRPNSFSRSSFFKEIQLGRPWLHCPENAERSISRSKAFISSWFICRPARIDR